MKIAEVEAGCREVLATLSRIIVGKDDVLRRLLAGILANGHILIEDYPGLAKTLIARLLSEAFDLKFRRVQFTPDLLPGDITGSFLYDQREGRFEFRRGPIFTQLLLADEINRATPKTQSALLEAMQEGQVTVEGSSYPLDTPFLVIATQNPIDLEGTYALPEAQLDRFMMRIAVGYPGREEEREILSRRRARRSEEAHVDCVVSRDELLAMQAALEDVHVDRSIRGIYCRHRPRDTGGAAGGARRLAARDARFVEARPRRGGAAAQRFRDPGRCQGDGGGRIGPPPDAAPRAVGRQCRPRRHRAGHSRQGADAESGCGMTRRATPHAFAAATLIAWALFLGVLADRAELFIAVIPLAVGLVTVDCRRPPRFTWRQQISADRLAEGDRVTATVTLNSTDRVAMVEILAALPALVAAAGGGNRVVRAAPAGEDMSWSYELSFPARGRFDLGEFHLRFWDGSGFTVTETRIDEPRPVAVYPFIERIRQPPLPLQTQFSFGNYVSPQFGEGIEPGDVRLFLAGDRVRHINWRASLRRGQLYITEFHEERNADVVLLLDALSETGAPAFSTLDFSVRAAAALAGAYLARKDRVGFLEYGGYLRWIDPATGRRQRQAIRRGVASGRDAFQLRRAAARPAAETGIAPAGAGHRGDALARRAVRRGGHRPGAPPLRCARPGGVTDRTAATDSQRLSDRRAGIADLGYRVAGGGRQSCVPTVWQFWNGVPARRSMWRWSRWHGGGRDGRHADEPMVGDAAARCCCRGADLHRAILAGYCDNGRGRFALRSRHRAGSARVR